VGRGYNTQFLLYPRPFDVTEGIFAVLYVSVMGLTRFYKTTVFLHLLRLVDDLEITTVIKVGG